MRVGIDYWPATTHAPGIGRYVRELVRALVRRADGPWLGLFDVGPLVRSVPAAALGLDGHGARYQRLALRLPHRLVALAPLAADRRLGGVDLFQRAFPHRPRIARATPDVVREARRHRRST